MNPHPDLALSDGSSIPQLGLGVWQTPPESTAAAVQAAIAAGYRLIDTAAAYRNEKGVGEGIRHAPGTARDDLFITTKLWNADQGFDETLRAFDRSMQNLQLDYLDLYLIHWPSPARNRYVDSWKALIQLRNEGRVRSIGVSNFEPEHLDRLLDETGVAPVLNQIELHPHFQQTRLRAYHSKHAIITQAWSPLGRGKLLGDPTIVGIAARHGKTPAQVIVRWHLQLQNAVIPKSVNPKRIEENADVFDFALDDDDMRAIEQMDRDDGRMGPDPMTAEFA